MKKKNKFIQNIIFNYFSFFSIILFLLIFFSLFFVILNTSLETVKSSRVEVLRQMTERNRMINKFAEYIANELYNNINGDLLYEESNNKKQILKEKIETIITKDNNILSSLAIKPLITVLMADGVSYISDTEVLYSDIKIKSIKNSYWYISNFSNDEDELWTVLYDAKNKKLQTTLSYGKIIRDDKKEYKGIILVSLEGSALDKIFANVVDDNTTIFVLDEKGKAISHSINTLVGVDLYYMPLFFETYEKNTSQIIRKNSLTVLMTNYFDPQSGWTIVEEKSLQSIINDYSQIIITFIILTIIALAFSILISLFLSRKIASPILKLKNQMVSSRTNELKKVDTRKEFREIEILSEIYNLNVDRINNLILQVKVEERAKQKSELLFRQSQINPHFMHNTLFTIKCLIEMKRYDKSISMISDFIQLLKNTSHVDSWITIEKEVIYLDSYVKLMQQRYIERNIILSIDVNEKIKDIYIPRLLIQPIIENSIFYGVSSEVSRDIEISVNIQCIGEKLIIRITDNGDGIDQDKLSSIWEKDEYPKSSFNSIGLKNIKDRVKLIYGDRANISIFSEKQIGTEIILTLRKITEETLINEDINN